ncbi:MAG: PmeII family type II restriction endonuclease [Anaerolineae bacterium]|nr:PmeII family type II restriction endonuclease [Anaerolineae bacterium]
MNTDELRALIAQSLGEFYRRRIQRLEKLKLKDVLLRKNPYLYKALGTQSATEIVEEIIKAYLSASDEGLFGEVFFEPIAKAVSGGVVSPSEGVDIAIETEDRYVAIAVKSGPNPYNASQVKRQSDEFASLRRRLIKLRKQFDPVLGHCYGKKQTLPTSRQIYRDVSGQKFWQELTGDPEFYLKLIRYMEDHVIAQHRETYKKDYQHAVNRYVREFTNDFCKEDGSIDWEKLVRFNSGAD